MNKEDLRARKPGIEAIKRAGLIYRPQTNYVAMARQFGVDDMSQESGIPDGIVHLPGSKICYVEFKQGQGALDLKIWRDNQRAWWEAWCLPTQTQYRILAWVSHERVITRANHNAASFYCVPAQIWIATEKHVAEKYGSTTVPAVSTYRSRVRETLDDLWAAHKLSRVGNAWVLDPALLRDEET